MPDMSEKLGRFTAKIMAEASAEVQRSMDQLQQEYQSQQQQQNQQNQQQQGGYFQWPFGW